jgi:hypothetical protein
MFFNIDGGRFGTSVNTHQGSRYRRFLTVIVGAPEPSSAPARGAAIDIF